MRELASSCAAGAAPFSSVSEIRGWIGSVWGGTPAEQAASALLAAFEERPSPQVMDFGELAAFARMSLTDALTACAVLNNRAGILQVGAVLRADGRDWELPPGALEAARKQGWIAHPGDGSRIEHWEQSVIPTVAAAPELLDLIARGCPPAASGLPESSTRVSGQRRPEPPPMRG